MLCSRFCHKVLILTTIFRNAFVFVDSVIDFPVKKKKTSYFFEIPLQNKQIKTPLYHQYHCRLHSVPYMHIRWQSHLERGILSRA